MTTTTVSPTGRELLPWSALLALGSAVFLTSLTETLPAGVLPQMTSSLGVSSGAAGQAVTVYAAGTALTAIPLAAATAGVRRKPLLLCATTVFLIANTLTAAAPGYAVLLCGRFLAGVAAGLAWAILAGYARRIASPGLEGRAIAIAMAGIPLALSLGVPAGTLIGQQIGWRASFAAVSVITLAVIGWIAFSVPAVSRPTTTVEEPKPTIRETLRVPGVGAVMVVVVTFVLGHTIIYAYIAPYLRDAGLATAVDAILLAFGIACLVSIWYTGRHIDGHLRGLALTAATLFTLATAAFAATTAQAVVWVAALVWGLGWGGTPTLLQTAAGHAGMRRGPAIADTAQALLVSLWNAAMALGGIIGGVLLQRLDITADAIAAAALGVLSLLVIALMRKHAFATENQDAP
ncbi:MULTISPECIES: MFS transporter [unclassified Streptomyces]|uniref:MFS transporter n=1 Tax=unclassified Streptomyces TaxID=2593676 RepID=UPI00382DBDF8|nr:MFS transporter [Streptomyces sp. NBC_01176]